MPIAQPCLKLRFDELFFEHVVVIGNVIHISEINVMSYFVLFPMNVSDFLIKNNATIGN